MVKIEEVADEDLLLAQQGPVGGDEDWDDTDTESDTSSVLDDSYLQESLYERLNALKDIIPPSSRDRIAAAVGSTYNALSSGLVFSGKALWVISSSALLLGVPWALAYAEEQQLAEMEREMKMQQSANELMTPGASSQPAGQASAAL